MPVIINGSSGITFPDTSVQAVTATNATNITSGTLAHTRLPTGSVLQVVSSSYSTAVSNSTTSFATSGLTASITPKFSTSKILVLINVTGSQKATASDGTNFAIYKNGSLLQGFGTITGYLNTGGITVASNSVNYLDSPATTSSTTYALYFNTNTSGQASIAQANNTPSFITLMEIAA